MEKELEFYDNLIEKCKSIFNLKKKEYGNSWVSMRLSSLTDQIKIKILRIDNILNKKKNLVGESIENDIIGAINYCIISIIKFQSKNCEFENVENLYDEICFEQKELFIKKNHDYNSAWKVIRTTSIIDMILAKINRIKNIEDNFFEKEIISENLDSNYMDISIYSCFLYFKEIQNL